MRTSMALFLNNVRTPKEREGDFCRPDHGQYHSAYGGWRSW